MQIAKSPRVIAGLIATSLGTSSLIFIPGLVNSEGGRAQVPSETASLQPSDSVESTPDSRTALFQSQASLSDGLPNLPFMDGNVPSTANSGSITPPPIAGMPPPSMNIQAELPSFPSTSSPATLPTSPQRPSAASTVDSPASIFPPAGDASSRNFSGRSPGPTPFSSNQSVQPPVQPAVQSSTAAGGLARNAAAPQSVPGKTVGYQAGTQTATDGNALRSIDSQKRMQDGFQPSGSIATGLPYVTPAPRGRYPTSPYNHAVFQTAAYQRGETQASMAKAPQSNASQGSSGRLTSTSRSVSQAAPVGTQAGLPQFSQPGPYPTAYQCPPAPGAGSGVVPSSYIPPTYTPNYAPAMYSQSDVGCRPLVSLGQQNYNVVMGRGIIGQPVVYVPGQPVRNFMRYIFP